MYFFYASKLKTQTHFKTQFEQFITTVIFHTAVHFFSVDQFIWSRKKCIWYDSSVSRLTSRSFSKSFLFDQMGFKSKKGTLNSTEKTTHMKQLKKFNATKILIFISIRPQSSRTSHGPTNISERSNVRSPTPKCSSTNSTPPKCPIFLDLQSIFDVFPLPYISALDFCISGKNYLTLTIAKSLCFWSPAFPLLFFMYWAL